MSRSSESRSRVSVAQDKGSIVIDIGKVYTRCGLSGDPAPRHIIRSQVSMKPYGQIQDVWDPKYLNREELYLILCRFMQNIYLKHLMVNPKDHRVVVVESLLCPNNFRNTLARVLFNHLNVPYAAFVPSHLLCLFTIGRQSALVVDVGHLETTVLPVYEGIPLVVGWQNSGCAAHLLHSSVKSLLQVRGVVRCVESGEEKPVGAVQVDSLLESATEDIIVQTCFVRSRSLETGVVPPNVDYPLNTKYTLIIDGHTRHCAADVLFDDGSEDQSLPECILEALMKCSSSCRKELSENILVVGGIAGLPGFNYRLKEELEALVQHKMYRYRESLGALKFKFHEPPAHTNSVAWVGGSIFGSSEVAVLERAISREKFRELRRLPDWTSCDPDQREHIRVVPTRKLLPAAPSGSSSSLRQTSTSKT